MWQLDKRKSGGRVGLLVIGVSNGAGIGGRGQTLDLSGRRSSSTSLSRLQRRSFHRQ